MFLKSPCGWLSSSLSESEPRRMDRFRVMTMVSFEQFIGRAQNV